MRNSDSPQGIYAPLSQAMTDSESEEEILSSSRHHRNSNHIIMQNSVGAIMTDVHCTNFTHFNSDGEERNHTDADNVAILGTDTKREPMSTIRKCCFVISILVCVLTVVIFLWIVPCGEGSTCPAPQDRIKSHNWLNNYTRIELKGVVNVVGGLRSWERNLIFMYRGNKFFPEFEQNIKKRNGIISLVGSSGAIAWYDEMINEPIAIDCTLIDADKNGSPDCLVMDEVGQVGVLNPVSGQWIWKFFDKSTKKIDALDFPVILPDLDGDGTNELLLATNNGQSTRNYLRILSGRTGQPIQHGYQVTECTYVHKFQLDHTLTVNFNCINNDTEVQRFKSVSELYSLITNKSIGQKLSPEGYIGQHKLYGQRKETEAQRNIYSISGRELVVENRGKCPENCNVTFTLSEKRNGKTYIIENFNGTSMYGMVPAQLSFKTKEGGNKLTGFVLKFWDWSKNHTNIHENVRQKRNENDHTFEYNIFDHLIHKRRSFTVSGESMRPGRSIANITKQKSSSNILPNYKMRLIKERVVLIIFNSADIHIENTSQSNIVQFCRSDKSEMICQPDLNYQENSVLIADLDQDGSQELVSYYSTFVNKEEDRKDWKLVTYVRLLRLESELPLLYEGVKKN